MSYSNFRRFWQADCHELEAIFHENPVSFAEHPRLHFPISPLLTPSAAILDRFILRIIFASRASRLQRNCKIVKLSKIRNSPESSRWSSNSVFATDAGSLEKDEEESLLVWTVIYLAGERIALEDVCRRTFSTLNMQKNDCGLMTTHSQTQNGMELKFWPKPKERRIIEKTDDTALVTAETGDGFGKADWAMGFLSLPLSLSLSLGSPLLQHRWILWWSREKFPHQWGFSVRVKVLLDLQDAAKQSDLYLTAWKLFWIRLLVGLTCHLKFVRYGISNSNMNMLTVILVQNIVINLYIVRYEATWITNLLAK